jgi:predicted  nucleic acid-binding Zn-ribbon protein
MEARGGGEAGARSGPHVEALEHELALSHEIRRRLQAEVRRLEARVTALESEAGHLRGILSERERYLQAIRGSLVWRSAQALRRLAGRAW